jgi:hypothetical protein
MVYSLSISFGSDLCTDGASCIHAFQLSSGGMILFPEVPSSVVRYVFVQDEVS